MGKVTGVSNWITNIFWMLWKFRFYEIDFTKIYATFFTYMHNFLRLSDDFFYSPHILSNTHQTSVFVHNYLIWMMLLLVNFLFGPLFVQNIYSLEVWVSGTRFGQNGYFFGWLEGWLKMNHNLNIFKARFLNIYFLIYSLWLFCWKTYIVLLLLIFLSGLYHWQWQVDTCMLNVSVPTGPWSCSFINATLWGLWVTKFPIK